MTPTATTANLDLNRLQTRSLIVGVAATALCIIGGLFNAGQFFRSYLIAYLFWIGVALGGLSLLMLYHLVGGNWGYISRRLFEAAARTIPFMAILIIPLIFGVHSLYRWSRPEEVAKDPVLQGKTLYLNLPFFFTRMAIYFLVWSILSYRLNSWSTEQDRTANPRIKDKLKAISGPGLALNGFMITFAIVDWVMSLQPDWYSTIFGMIFIVGQVLSMLSMTVLMLTMLSDVSPFAGKLKPQHFHDLGNLMLAFVMLWAYTSFSQFLLIWSGNLPDENPWYLRRLYNGWGYIAVMLVVFHFALPFLLLLMRYVKTRGRLLAKLALVIIVVRIIDMYWNVEPAFHPQYFYFHWLDLAAPIGLGGLWLALFAWQLKSRPLLALHDDRIEAKY
jgi:hypothetical protein